MTLLSLALTLIAVIVFTLSHRYAWWRRTVDYGRPRILMYHMVREAQPGAKFNKLRVSPANFERQIRWLAEQGWYFASMSDLSKASRLPAKTVVLTFDDGYEDNLLNADPVLARYGAKATLYVVEDRFDRDWSSSKKAHHDSGELMREPKLTDLQLEQMLASGRWELGGHTRTHANLAKLDQTQRETEIAGARQSMAARFSVPMESFAYPFGIYGPEDVAAAVAAGFTSAVTTREGIPEDVASQTMELPRIKISGNDTMLAFRLRLRTGHRGV
ncbi:MAG: polysaccharide deacetylase family protein [Congregibacter sp.]|nr:polysaccharide deacetylase family protein [Congregibacter sp.]